MIAVDTSALMAVALGDPDAPACAAALIAEPRILISAASVAEALIVAAGRNVGPGMRRLLGEAGLEVVPVTAAAARRVADAYAKWGKGRHPAGLNYGDCFAYEVARHFGCPLLFIGGDFNKTDLVSAL